MKTGCWTTYRGPGRIRISIGKPRWVKEEEYATFLPLAPSREMLSLSKEEYIVSFGEQLAELDPVQISRDLHHLAKGYEPVLMCFEKPPFTRDNWCHRRIVAEWLEEAMSEHRDMKIEIPEVAVKPKFIVPQQILL